MYIGKVNKFALLHGFKAKYNVVGPQDGYLKIGKERYVVFCRGELRKYQIPDLIEQKEFHKKIIVVAENLFSAIKGELVAHGINYLEENGNTYTNFRTVLRSNGLKGKSPNSPNAVFGKLITATDRSIGEIKTYCIITVDLCRTPIDITR